MYLPQRQTAWPSVHHHDRPGSQSKPVRRRRRLRLNRRKLRTDPPCKHRPCPLLSLRQRRKPDRLNAETQKDQPPHLPHLLRHRRSPRRSRLPHAPDRHLPCNRHRNRHPALRYLYRCPHRNRPAHDVSFPPLGNLQHRRHRNTRQHRQQSHRQILWPYLLHPRRLHSCLSLLLPRHHLWRLTKLR